MELRTDRLNIPTDSLLAAGGGEMSELIRSKDWSKTPLGPIEDWSQSLRMMISFLLANRFPLLLWWGSQYISLYNDAYRPIFGNKHPDSLGQPVSQCWSEIWHILKPLIDTPFNGGLATWMEDILLEVNRHGFLEETHFTIAYSPVPDDTAAQGIGGVLATVHEITQKVVGERRVLALRDLGARVAEAKTGEGAYAVAADTLAKYPQDLPFALLYLIAPDGERAHLAGAAGVSMGEPISPLAIALGGESQGTSNWPLAEAMRTETLQVVEDLGARFSVVPAGPWTDPPHAAVVMPIPSIKAHQVAGWLVAGVSSRLQLDEPYRSFFELTANQIATALANARAYKEARKRAAALAEIDRVKTAFFSNVSHEFRTPLTLMLGPLEEALADDPARLPEHRGELDVERRLASSAVRAQAYVEEALRWLPDSLGRSDEAPERAIVPDEGPRARGARVLLAEDNADMRAYVRRLLGAYYEVDTVANGAEALEAIRARCPDLVLADVMMPRLDGFGLLRAIRDDPALCELPLIMVSARAGEESRVEGLEAGADDYLVKPFAARERSR